MCAISIWFFDGAPQSADEVGLRMLCLTERCDDLWIFFFCSSAPWDVSVRRSFIRCCCGTRQVINLIEVLTWDNETVYGIAGETCCGREANLYSNYFQKELNNEVIVKSVSMGKTKHDDFTLSLTMHPFDQVRVLIPTKKSFFMNFFSLCFFQIDIVCNKLKQNPQFRDGYNAVGLSQGALFL